MSSALSIFVVIASVFGLAVVLRSLSKGGTFLYSQCPGRRKGAVPAVVATKALLSDARSVNGDGVTLDVIQRMADQKYVVLKSADVVDCSDAATHFLLDRAVSRLAELVQAGSSTLRLRKIPFRDFDPEQGHVEMSFGLCTSINRRSNIASAVLDTRSSLNFHHHDETKCRKWCWTALKFHRHRSTPTFGNIPIASSGRHHVPTWSHWGRGQIVHSRRAGSVRYAT